VFGDTGAGAIIRAGTASSTGGLATGNSFPAAEPWAGGSRETGPAIYNADLIQGRTAGVIIPAIFESDRASSLRETYNVAVRNARPVIQSSLAALLRGSALRTAAQFLVRGESVGLGGLASTLSHGASFTGERVDRPIGMRPPPGGSNFTFVPQALVLTYESAELIARSDLFGRGRGVVEIRYTDDSRLRGDYSLYLLVERVP
jgi:hypothetical protein